MPHVEELGVAAVKCLHPDTQVSVRGLDEQMDVICHQAEGEPAPPPAFDNPAEEVQIATPICVVPVDRSLVHAPRKCVIDAPLQVFAWFAGHAQTTPQTASAPL